MGRCVVCGGQTKGGARYCAGHADLREHDLLGPEPDLDLAVSLNRQLTAVLDRLIRVRDRRRAG